jgi:hypothetical protein
LDRFQNQVCSLRGCPGQIGPTADSERAILLLAKSLGRPVAKGQLNSAQAEAALLVQSIRLDRDGFLEHDPIDVARIATHITHLNARNLTAKRETTIGAIRRGLQPLLGIGARSNRLRAAAHDENGAAGFPLSEPEVDEIVAMEIWKIMQAEAQYG